MATIRNMLNHRIYHEENRNCANCNAACINPNKLTFRINKCRNFELYEPKSIKDFIAHFLAYFTFRIDDFYEFNPIDERKKKFFTGKQIKIQTNICLTCKNARFQMNKGRIFQFVACKKYRLCCRLYNFDFYEYNENVFEYIINYMQITNIEKIEQLKRELYDCTFVLTQNYAKEIWI